MKKSVFAVFLCLLSILFSGAHAAQKAPVFPRLLDEKGGSALSGLYGRELPEVKDALDDKTAQGLLKAPLTLTSWENQNAVITRDRKLLPVDPFDPALSLETDHWYIQLPSELGDSLACLPMDYGSLLLLDRGNRCLLVLEETPEGAKISQVFGLGPEILPENLKLLCGKENLAVLSYDGKALYFVDLGLGKALPASLPDGWNAVSGYFSDSGPQLYLLSDEKDRLRLIDFDTGEILEEHGLAGSAVRGEIIDVVQDEADLTFLLTRQGETDRIYATDLDLMKFLEVRRTDASGDRLSSVDCLSAEEHAQLENPAFFLVFLARGSANPVQSIPDTGSGWIDAARQDEPIPPKEPPYSLRDFPVETLKFIHQATVGGYESRIFAPPGLTGFPDFFCVSYAALDSTRMLLCYKCDTVDTWEDYAVFYLCDMKSGKMTPLTASRCLEGYLFYTIKFSEKGFALCTDRVLLFKDGRPAGELSLPDVYGVVTGYELSPDLSKVLLNAVDPNNIDASVVYSFKTGKASRREPVFCTAWAPDSSRYAALEYDAVSDTLKSLSIINLTNHVEAEFPIAMEHVLISNLTWRDAHTLLLCTHDTETDRYMLYEIDTKTGAIKKLFEEKDGLYYICLSGGFAMVNDLALSSHKTLDILDTKTGELTEISPSLEGVASVWPSNEGTAFVANVSSQGDWSYLMFVSKSS